MRIGDFLRYVLTGKRFQYAHQERPDIFYTQYQPHMTLAKDKRHIFRTEVLGDPRWIVLN